MAKKLSLNGSEPAGFIKERQASTVRSLDEKPCLAIVRTNTDPITGVYLKIKKSYADDIGAKVEIVETSDKNIASEINLLNGRKDVHGIIIQLPLKNPTQTNEIINLVAADKDVDGLGSNSPYEPATPLAILWLLASYNIDLRGKRVLIVGQGRLVGAPLAKMLLASGVDTMTADDKTNNLTELCLQSQIIITATGQPGLITSEMIQPGTIVVDAGTSTDQGGVVGDVAESVRMRDDISITPPKGGVGPLTVAALFENLLIAYRKQTNG